jgi:hypothetical protein
MLTAKLQEAAANTWANVTASSKKARPEESTLEKVANNTIVKVC